MPPELATARLMYADGWHFYSSKVSDLYVSYSKLRVLRTDHYQSCKHRSFEFLISLIFHQIAATFADSEVQVFTFCSAAT